MEKWELDVLYFENGYSRMYDPLIILKIKLWVRIFEQITIYRRLRTGVDGHLNQSKAYDLS